MSGRVAVKKPAGKSHIKYYFDDESKPRVDLTIDDLFGGKVAPFTEPFAFLDPRPRFGILYYPFAFKKHLKVTTTDDFTKLADPNTCWYQYTYLTYADTNAVTTWAGPEQDSPTVRSSMDAFGTRSQTRGRQCHHFKYRLDSQGEKRRSGGTARRRLNCQSQTSARALRAQTILPYYSPNLLGWRQAPRGGDAARPVLRRWRRNLRELPARAGDVAKHALLWFRWNEPRVLLLLAYALLAFGALGACEQEWRGLAVGFLRAAIQAGSRAGLPGRTSRLFLRQAHSCP